MADIISLTGPEVRFNIASSPFPSSALYTAIDVAEYDLLNFSIYCTYRDATNNPSCLVQIWTGMQTDTTDGWVTTSASATVNAVGVPLQAKLGPGGFLRYIAWSVPTFTNSGYIGICVQASCHKRALVTLP